MQGEASTASLRSPTGLTNSSRPSAFWSGIGEYLSVERAVTTASDLISCGPLAYTAVVAGLPEGWGEGLGAMVLAKCLPQLMGDVALPNAVNAALHSGMDLLLPSGTVAGLAVSLGFDSKYTFVAAGVGSAVSDLREMIENAANLSKIDTQELIEGFDWLGKQMDFMDEAERILNERSETEHSQDGGRSDEFEQPERIDAQGAGPNLPISQPAPEKPGADIGLD